MSHEGLVQLVPYAEVVPEKLPTCFPIDDEKWNAKVAKGSTNPPLQTLVGPPCVAYLPSLIAKHRPSEANEKKKSLHRLIESVSSIISIEAKVNVLVGIKGQRRQRGGSLDLRACMI